MIIICNRIFRLKNIPVYTYVLEKLGKCGVYSVKGEYKKNNNCLFSKRSAKYKDEFIELIYVLKLS